jgi:hypothetical protein
MFIMMLVYILFIYLFIFGGGGYYVMPLLLLGCVATHTLFFLWGIFIFFLKIMGWV